MGWWDTAKKIGKYSAGVIPGLILDGKDPFEPTGTAEERAGQASAGWDTLGDKVQSGVTPMEGSPQIGDSGFSSGLQGNIDLLSDRAKGNNLVSSLIGEAQRGTANRQALAQSAASGNSPLAARLASQQIGRQNVGIAGQTAIAGAQEAAQAAGLAGQLGLSARGQDFDKDFNQGKLDLQAQDLRQKLGLGQAGINAGLLGSLLGVQPGPSLFQQAVGGAAAATPYLL